MLQTLFHIPPDVSIAGHRIPLFGWGLLLAVWAVVVAVYLAWQISRHGFAWRSLVDLPLLLMFGLFIGLVVPAMSEPEGLAIRGYGAVLVVAVVLAVGLTARRARQLGVDPELIYAASFWLFVWGIIGARVFYIVQYWDQFRTADGSRVGPGQLLFELVNVAQGGLVVYGALLGGGAALAWFVYRHRLPALATVDLFAPSVVLAMGIGRLGCFLNGCCYGGPTDLPWGVCFPQGSPPFVRQAEQGRVFLHGLKFDGPISAPAVIAAVEPDSPAAAAGLRAGDRIARVGDERVESIGGALEGLLTVKKLGQEVSITVAGQTKPHVWIVEHLGQSEKIHPTQIYSAIDAILLGFLLSAYFPYRRRDGEVLALALALHAVTRYLLEAIRTDESKNIFGSGMTISQNISLAVLVAAVGLWIYILSTPRGTTLPERASLFARAN